MKNNLKRNSKLDKIKTSPLEGEVDTKCRVRGNKNTATSTKLASPAPVILCLVHRIFWQRVSNLVNKLALLLGGACLVPFACSLSTPYSVLLHHSLPQRAREQIGVAFSNKVMDTRLPQPTGCGDKYDIDSKVQCGRSMIEMLGVLAIIAVLSVGGLAGYSKAMQKFKLNRWKEYIVTLTSNLKIMYMNEKSYTNTDNQMMMNVYKDIGIIPQNMLDEQNKDIFGNSWQIYSFTPPNSNIGSRLFLRFWTLPDTNAVETCKEMFYLQSEYDDSWGVVLNEGITGRSGGILTVCGKSAPDNYAKDMHCEPFDLSVIAARCGVCSKQRCDLILVLANGR